MLLNIQEVTALWQFVICLYLPTRAFSLNGQQSILLVSFDGFRWDYIHRVPMPHFQALLANGVYVTRVENAYITKTFPNHYTLVTGLHAESHGIVANEMYDPSINKTFSTGSSDVYESVWWDEAFPIWVTNQNEGHRSGAAMWPGSDVKIHNVHPSYYMPYNMSVPFTTRVDQLLGWFSGKDYINLGLLYWEEPDEMGHTLGPDSPDMDKVIEDIDLKLGYVMEQLQKAKLMDKVNIIVTSDHGMAQLSPDRVIVLDDIVDRDLYTLVDKSPVAAILPKQGRFDDVYNALINANLSMTVYKKTDIPERLHYKHNDRIQPIILEAKEGWTIVQNRSEHRMLGNHGYDNTFPSMQPLLVAHGPAFKKNYTKQFMKSVDLYPLMCHILGINPKPHNGSLANVQDLLADSKPTSEPPQPEDSSYALLLGALLGCILVIAFLAVFVKQITRSQMPRMPISNIEIAQPLLQA
ncbi:ectonucleotide pyrophosphatase/phosphodiesterase family member 5 [Erpetoichthys calabaricus]|uniref:Ectonucleotide pyrophosphatase/phosphodiesterase 5 n=1 Tax=Erpetoichthys calabaricus TaxID=27687 RepID=A0A8C4RVE0_ERPCA|nr:ectonucleotide pyrophosphatase/phosphodiesterase family member 5 [Erpetoichthys calabaricus]XP_051780404.1 ectonucleotide pyrophosphatase/phosphodiesterase family member 5 [Erpetoichthys calabaricus]